MLPTSFTAPHEQICSQPLQEANVHLRAPPARGSKLGPPSPLMLAVLQDHEDALGPAGQVHTGMAAIPSHLGHASLCLQLRIATNVSGIAA